MAGTLNKMFERIPRAKSGHTKILQLQYYFKGRLQKQYIKRALVPELCVEYFFKFKNLNFKKYSKYQPSYVLKRGQKADLSLNAHRKPGEGLDGTGESSLQRARRQGGNYFKPTD